MKHRPHRKAMTAEKLRMLSPKSFMIGTTKCGYNP